MKKTVTVIALLLFAGVGAFAQGISGGIKGGLNVSNATFKTEGFTTSTGMLPGFHGGAYLTAMITERFGVQPELLYSGQGYKSGDEKLQLTYINIPVLVRFNVNSLVSFHAGPQFGILASAKDKYSSGSVDVKDQLKGSDVSIAAGVGIDLPIKLNFSFRFVKGMSNIAKDSGNASVKNYGLQFSVGYKLFGN